MTYVPAGAPPRQAELAPPTFWNLDRVADALEDVAITPPPRGPLAIASVST
ncbi:MAG: hypothetical protein K0S86_5008, partial [Geminicoccaceae bacterium]|nr:hypothetical protein [Geminicoccaceae bacterium]